MSWTAARVEACRELWFDGLSAIQCAQKLGGLEHCSDHGKNAVISLVHRQGWARPKPARSVERKPRQTMANGALIADLSVVERFNARKPAHFIGVTFEELNDAHCRWPNGDKLVLYCGQPKMMDSSYCVRCTQRAFVSEAVA